MKKTPQIKRGLIEFTYEECELAVQLNEQGNGGNSIAYMVLPSKLLNDKTESQITYMGDRLIATGKYLREQV
jgi:hypothetical protein